MWNSFRTDDPDGLTAEVITYAGGGGDEIHATTGIGDDLRGEAVAVVGLKRVPHGAVAYRACPEPVMTGCVMAAGDPGAREMIAGP